VVQAEAHVTMAAVVLMAAKVVAHQGREHQVVEALEVLLMVQHLVLT